MTSKQIAPVLTLFVVVNSLLLFANFNYDSVGNFKLKFIMGVNTILFAMAIFNFIRFKKMNAGSPQAMVRSVMMGSLLKMVLFAGAALIYATQVKTPVGMPSLLVSMALYLLYTWLEIRWTQIKK